VIKDLVVLGDRNPAFVTHRELDAALALLPDGVSARWVGTDTSDARRTTDADGLWVVPGTPYHDDDAAYAAITAARTTGQPLLGTCGGFQYMVVEFARNVAGIADAAHAETSPDAEHAVVGRLGCSLVGQERLVKAVPGTRMADLCGLDPFVGFHWCNYGLEAGYVDRLTTHGLVVSAYADDAGVEAVEVPESVHPFFMATLFQPQVGSIVRQPLHPVIRAFVRALQCGR
jgi:CTP synthase (UTP-ammonia lyase)